MEYQRKHAVVEARVYEGPKLTVVSALKGEQTCVSGDYLVTDPVAVAELRSREVAEKRSEGELGEKGTVYVVAKVEFEAEFKALPPPPEPPSGTGGPTNLDAAPTPAIN